MKGQTSASQPKTLTSTPGLMEFWLLNEVWKEVIECQEHVDVADADDTR